MTVAEILIEILIYMTKIIHISQNATYTSDNVTQATNMKIRNIYFDYNDRWRM